MCESLQPRSTPLGETRGGEGPPGHRRAQPAPKSGARSAQPREDQEEGGRKTGKEREGERAKKRQRQQKRSRREGGRGEEQGEKRKKERGSERQAEEEARPGGSEGGGKAEPEPTQRRPRRLEAPQAGSGILSVERHRKPLQEHNGTGAFGRELACSQSRSLGKLGPDAPGHFTPAAADGLHDHGDESNALRLALGTGIVVAALEVLIAVHDAAWVVDSLCWQVHAEPRRDSEVPGGWRAQPPPRHIHVSRATRTGVAILLANLLPALV